MAAPAQRMSFLTVEPNTPSTPLVDIDDRPAVGPPHSLRPRLAHIEEQKRETRKEGNEERGKRAANPSPEAEGERVEGSSKMNRGK
ncbi:hypothetical protein H6P81_010077 [Aristolochia fimbriata]|uniref:Uncharacterized protein n=1 Tax=Aristolochia fimbriata TaxID=158543 RepID=A0AAV7EMR9_ARIFI|nr:hypothetical protein H6P81_010077 [Aristolochia fimbriata]